MRTRLFAVPATFALVATLGACGSTTERVSAPPTTHAKLALSKVAAGTADAAIYPARTTVYTLDGTLADLGSAAPVRKLIGHEMTDADLARIAAALGMQGTPRRTADGASLENGDATLTITTTGGVTVVDYFQTAGAAGVDGGSSAGSPGTASDPPIPAPDVKPDPMPTMPPPVDVPSADDAANIAQSLLDNLGVLDGQQWSHAVEDPDTAVSSCAAADGSECPPTEPMPVYSRTVTYELLIDGQKAPGVSWSVAIGERGRIEYLSGTWISTQDLGEYPLISTTQAFEDLKKGDGLPQPMTAQDTPAIAEAPDAPNRPDTIDPPPAIQVRITGASLGVMRWDGTENGNPVAYLVPTYRFHANTDGSEYDVEVIALDPASFTLTPSDVASARELPGQEVEK